MTNRKTELHLFFPTTIWTAIIEDNSILNTKMYDYIKNLQLSNPKSIKKSNFGGWHSKNFDILNGPPNELINKISPMLNEAMIDMKWDLERQKINITNMWSIINNKESFNERHIHGNNFISAAYYVKAPKNCGNIVFYDPRSAPIFSHPLTKEPNRLNASTQSIEPQDGLLVLFPSYLYHSVEQNFSNDERIVISFNLNLIKN